jgi:diadenylate cyclase
MDFADRIQGLLTRLGGYRPWEVAFELLVIALVVWMIVRFVQGTRAAGALKTILVLLVLATLSVRVLGDGSGGGAFQRLVFLFDRLLAIAAIGLVIIFQPELRRAVFRLAEAPLFRSSPTEIAAVVEELVEACTYLSKSRFGAIIVLQRQTNLEGLIEGGTPIGAQLTAPLLQTIFYPSTALHDLAVIVQGKVVKAAGVQLPLAEPSEMPDIRLGSRHRAAVGLTKECDALVIVVSEETGLIRLAERGELSAGMKPADFGDELTSRLRREPLPPPAVTAEEVQETQMLAMPQQAVESPVTREIADTEPLPVAVTPPTAHARRPHEGETAA